MKLYEKIRDVRKNVLKLSLKEFHKKLVDIFGKKALTYYSLCRLEKGYREDIRLKSLYQICTGLGIPLKELKEGTEQEASKIVNIIRGSERPDNKYIYNERAIAEILSSRNIKFLAMELLLLPGGATKKEEDPVDVNRFEKLLIVLQGEILCHIGTERHLIKKGDTLSFASNIPHHFENPSKEIKARCIIVQNPKSY
ncbi:MAG: cupin domain-containing protein [Candidatus Omnitrophica bacterium]|nr:cupin domain-containing protein [Candidatus Omnitrophota bacterium]